MPFLKKILSTESLDLSKNTQNSLAQRSLGEAGSLRSQNSKGFTLIELLVVIAVIGILASIALITYGKTQVKSRDAKRKADLQIIKKALELYRQDSLGYYYPYCKRPGYGWFCALETAIPSIEGSYIDKIPRDPRNDYYYFYWPQPNNCNNSETYGFCTTYLIAACLENTSDPQNNSFDPEITTDPSCDSGWGYRISPY